jgi:hypothetical protein
MDEGKLHISLLWLLPSGKYATVLAPCIRRTSGKTAPGPLLPGHAAPVTGVAGLVGGVGVAGRRGVGAQVGHGCGFARRRRSMPRADRRATAALHPALPIRARHGDRGRHYGTLTRRSRG